MVAYGMSLGLSEFTQSLQKNVIGNISLGNNIFIFTALYTEANMLTHSDHMMPNGDIDLGQHWLR